jgi:hypothetical protein
MHGIMQEQAILLCELNYTPEDGTIDPKKAIVSLNL